MSCCEHCPLPKSAEELEEEAFQKSKRALLGYRSPSDRARRAIVDAIRAARPIINVTHVYTPAVLPPAPHDPYRPRG